MKKTSIVSLGILLVATMMLSGCLFPFWVDDGGHGGGHGGGRGGGHEEHEGHRDGGERH